MSGFYATHIRYDKLFYLFIYLSNRQNVGEEDD